MREGDKEREEEEKEVDLLTVKKECQKVGKHNALSVKRETETWREERERVLHYYSLRVVRVRPDTDNAASGDGGDDAPAHGAQRAILLEEQRAATAQLRVPARQQLGRLPCGKAHAAFLVFLNFVGAAVVPVAVDSAGQEVRRHGNLRWGTRLQGR